MELCVTLSTASGMDAAIRAKAMLPVESEEQWLFLLDIET